MDHLASSVVKQVRGNQIFCPEQVARNQILLPRSGKMYLNRCWPVRFSFVSCVMLFGHGLLSWLHFIIADKRVVAKKSVVEIILKNGNKFSLGNACFRSFILFIFSSFFYLAYPLFFLSLFIFLLSSTKHSRRDPSICKAALILKRYLRAREDI